MLFLFYLLCGFEIFLGRKYFSDDVSFTLFVVGIVFVNIKIYYLIKKKRNKKKWLDNNIFRVDKMTGQDFELFLQAHFTKKKYIVKHVGKSGDYGADLILRKGTRKTVVQAKRYEKNVGVRAIQEVIAAREYYHCKDAIVVTNSHFTKSAKEMARKCNVKLMDREYIIKYFNIPYK